MPTVSPTGSTPTSAARAAATWPGRRGVGSGGRRRGFSFERGLEAEGEADRDDEEAGEFEPFGGGGGEGHVTQSFRGGNGGEGEHDAMLQRAYLLPRPADRASR